MYHVILYKENGNEIFELKLSKHRKKELAIKSFKKFQDHPKLKEGWTLKINQYLPRKSKQNRMKRNQYRGAAPDLHKALNGIFK